MWERRAAQRAISLALYPHVGPICSLIPSAIERLTFCLGASDATYHVMWVIVFDAVDDFGIKELNDIIRNHNSELGPPQIPTHMDEVRGKVFDEALRGASRIAGLVRSPILPPASVFILHDPRLACWNRTNTWSVSLLG